jgi:cold shock CspA family protein
VLRELRGGQRRRGDAYGGRLRVYDQSLGSGPEGSYELEFSGEDVDPSCHRLAVGDAVHVCVVTDAQGGRRGTRIMPSRDPTTVPRAAGGTAAVPDGGASGEAPVANANGTVAEGDAIAANAAQGRDVGRVATLRDSYGFVRVHPASGGPASRDGEVPHRLFFHFSQVEGGFNQHSVLEGTEVSFTVAPDRRSGKITAQCLRVLPRGSLPAEGRKAAAEAEPPVLSRADASTSWARPTTLPPPGSEGGAAPGADVATSGAVAAVGWDGPGCELGVILTVRVKYGFIRCVERPADLFFHIDTAVADGVHPREELKPGRDVSFVYGSDPRDATRPVATRLRLAPLGAAVFDDVAEARLLGVVVQRIPTAKQPWPAGAGVKPGGDGPQLGSIEYIPPGGVEGGEAALPPVSSDAPQSSPEAVDDAELAHAQTSAETEDGGEAVKAEGGSGAPPAPGAVRIPFATSDLLPDTHPRPGDIVEFSIATHRRTQAQHASRVGLPLRSGIVAVVKPNYGFIQPTDGLQLPTGVGSKSAASKSSKASTTVFYHDSEVAGHVALGPRDEVEFLCCLNPKTGAPNARRVRRTKEAPAAPPPAVRHAREGGEAPGGAEPRPEALRREREPGSMVGRQATARVVEGPGPGQQGFTLGRGKSLALGITYGVQSSLRVNARPFQPPSGEAAAGDAERHADAE